jgi:hypothetical protein
MFLIAVVVAIAIIRLDLYLRVSFASGKPMVPRFEAEAARSILSTIAAGPAPEGRRSVPP